MLLMQADLSTLSNVVWNHTPTLLLHDPRVTKRMASILGGTATRGHLVTAGHFRDFYGPKAIYLGEKVSPGRIPPGSIQVNLLPTAATGATQRASRLTASEVQELQNMLFGYRVKNLVKVHNSDFDATALSSDLRAVTNALGACIVDSPKLQSELISLFVPVESQRQTDRSTGSDAVILEATLRLCHAGKQEFRASEVSIEANRIHEARGEGSTCSPEKVGQFWKKVGLYSHRLGGAGNGLKMDPATKERLRELAVVYGCVGSDGEGE
jgi:hypothetical protein